MSRPPFLCQCALLGLTTLSLSLAAPTPLLAPLYASVGSAAPKKTAEAQLPRFTYPDTTGRRRDVSRGEADGSPLGADLRALIGQLTIPKKRGAGLPAAFSAADLRNRFGIRPGDPNPFLRVAVTLAPGIEANQLTRAGVQIDASLGSIIYGTVPVRRLAGLATVPGVLSVEALPMTLPPLPVKTKDRPSSAFGARQRGEDAWAFDHQGLTGKGVAVAVIDSGIDYTHADFRNADGTTRLLALWDINDDTYARTGGREGNAPPAKDPKTGAGMGTVYTRAQINAALKAGQRLGTRDHVGHGTACAGVAAGNGRSAGGEAADYAGVAPEADLVVVATSPPDDDGEGGIDSYYALIGASWATQQARDAKEPCVLSMSFGSQYGPHNGTGAQQTAVNALVGAGKPGVAVCIAAGNEGGYTFHAAARFGPRKEGILDADGSPVELVVKETTQLVAYFDHQDDWGLCIAGLDRFLVAADGARQRRPAFLHLFPDDGAPGGLVVRLTSAAPGTNAAGPRASGSAAPSDAEMVPESGDAYRDSAHPELDRPLHGDPKTDAVVFTLPPGRYALMGMGLSEKVTSGRFSVYAPDPHAASFTQGGTQSGLVGSPGDAAGAICVGSYDGRGSWVTTGGKRVGYNVTPGEISGFSSPGYRRDGLIKPDVVAPGRYALSPLAPGSSMAKDSDPAHITRDGFHLAWEGTSAATPYVAGVVALMLQKNPTLDSVQIADILRKTAAAHEDDFTGRLPNPSWGNGKIDPAGALKATPAKPKSP